MGNISIWVVVVDCSSDVSTSNCGLQYYWFRLLLQTVRLHVSFFAFKLTFNKDVRLIHKTTNKIQTLFIFCWISSWKSLNTFLGAPEMLTQSFKTFLPINGGDLSLITTALLNLENSSIIWRYQRLGPNWCRSSATDWNLLPVISLQQV